MYTKQTLAVLHAFVCCHAQLVGVDFSVEVVLSRSIRQFIEDSILWF
jgi:hypothetical protein